MLTKYKLRIGSNEYELQDDDLKNWDEVKCVFKRADFGGVVRTFTSKFEFTNEAYRLLMQEYDLRGFRASATITIYVINDNWMYEPLFYCDLDFSSLTYTEYVLSMNAIDDSIASRIKAAKSTKFEFVVGEDIPVNGTKYLFDRIKMLETATYAITGGESAEDGSLTGDYTTDNNHRIYVGLTNSEIAIGKAVHLNEDQEPGDGYLFLSKESLDITLDYSVAVGLEEGCPALQLMRNDTLIKELHHATHAQKAFLWQDQSSIEAVMNYIYSDPERSHSWAYESWEGMWVSVQGVVWEVQTDRILGTNQWINTGKTKADYCSVEEHETITFRVSPNDKIWLRFASESNCRYKINYSCLKFTWTAQGSPVTIDSIAPDELLESLLWKMGVGCDSIISEYDKRLFKTLILPAESIRDIPGAKVYLSFNDFCNWIETVYGYTYVIDEDNDIIEFKHRKEIFSDNAKVVEIENAKDFNYKIENSVLYSSVLIGYEKKDYDSVNGRDEFNFNSSYTTGFSVNGKKIELKSPFRADSYGIEFLVEKRGQDTTDNNSDKDIFFVTGDEEGGYYKTNRSPKIINSITDSLINGEFSPIRCLFANSEYISIMAYSMGLKFASTEGNANIIIDNIGMSEDLTLEDNEMLTAGELSFVCGNLGLPEDVNCIIRVKLHDFIYEGYIRQVSFVLARPEAVEYTIMIKNKIPCS